MKKIIFTAFCILFCFNLNAQTTTGNGKIITKNYPVTGFNELNISVNAEIIFTQSNNYEVKITTDENIFDYISVKIKNEDLTIGRKAGKSEEPLATFSIGEKDVTIDSYNIGKIKPTKLVINISAPSLEDVNFTSDGNFTFGNNFSGKKIDLGLVGDGNIIANNAFSVEELDIEVSGSGEVKLGKVQITELEIGIVGSGNANLNGTYSEAEIEVAGSGNAKVSGTIDRAKAEIAGSGNIILGTVKSTLKYNIAGSGNITYSGNAALSGNTIGSGKIQHQ